MPRQFNSGYYRYRINHLTALLAMIQICNCCRTYPYSLNFCSAFLTLLAIYLPKVGKRKRKKQFCSLFDQTDFWLTHKEAWNVWLKVSNGQKYTQRQSMVIARANGTPPGSMLHTTAVQFPTLIFEKRGFPLFTSSCFNRNVPGQR